MRRAILSLMAIISITNSSWAQYSPDILGNDFEQMTLPLAPSYLGEPRATLVRRVDESSHPRALLYIHGYNDYFFQRELAQRFVDEQYRVYALDLRRYGRSLREGETPFEVRDIEEYFEEINLAIEQMHREGVEQITLMGHSTGGLIASLYCHSVQGREGVDRLILNSPFFAMNLNPTFVAVASPIIKALGALSPRLELFQDGSSLYGDSVNLDRYGEWEIDESLKMPISPPITAGWVRAILRAQAKLQRGLSIEIPILLLYSDRSSNPKEWSEECMTSDIVLNVKDIARYGGEIGSDVTQVEIERGMHDLLLSQPEVREGTYGKIVEWLRVKDNR